MTPLPNPRPDEVTVWLGFSPGLFVDWKLARHELDPLELVRAQAYAREADRARFIERRIVVRRVLGAYLGVDPAVVPLRQDHLGKPWLGGWASGYVDVSVAAAGSAVLVAVGRCGALGLGLEVHDRARDIPDELLDGLGPAERGFVGAAGARAREAFLRCMAARTAVVKASGLGPYLPPTAFEVNPETGTISGDPEVALPAVVSWFSPGSRCIAALATSIPVSLALREVPDTASRGAA